MSKKFAFLSTILALGAIFSLAAVLSYSALSENSDLDTYILEKIKTSHVPGLTACIVKHDKLVWANEYGWADIENKIPMTEDTIQNIGSISKTITATAIMQLWEKGKFKLDDDVNQYLSFKVRNPTFPDDKIHKDLILNRDSLICHKFYSPFSESDRQNFPMIKKRVVGVYGEYRRSHRPGHHHAGLDLWGAFNETVYAIGYGWVVRIFPGFPHRSVIVEHHLPDGSILYSAYVHIEDIKVEVGDWVDERTPLARVFNKKELERANFNTPNHLHLEIRKSLSDEGSASYASMNMRALNRFCLDPLQFFKNAFL